MSDETTEIRRKRLRYRSWYRGTKEMDVLLGHFAEAHLASFTTAQLARYDGLLSVEDPELYRWITGSAAIPPAHDHDVMSLLRNFKIKF